MKRTIPILGFILAVFMLEGCKDDPPVYESDPIVFTKHVIVFGIDVYATERTRDSKILHVANVLAEWLDSDEDGVPNNQEVVDAMVEDNSALLMTRTGNEFDMLDWHLVPDHGTGQGLWDEETHPGGAEEGIFDASLEEILHLVNFGYMEVYPDVFGTSHGTRIAIAMDRARGGYFRYVPDDYPPDAWYTYYDETCEYGCQINEYFYWALTSILGGQDFEGRLEDIDEEWRFNTRAKVEAGDTAIYALMTDPLYKLPDQLPDGIYDAETFTINEYP